MNETSLLLIKEGKSVSEVARTFSVHPATLYRILEPTS
jgi:transposase-like protein